MKEIFPSIKDSNIIGHSDVAPEGNLTQGHISFGIKLNKMSTVSIILIALMIEYFFDDLKKYRKNDILVNGYNYFQKS